MSTKKLSLGVAVLILTAGLALPAQAQQDESGAWRWLTVMWQGWFGLETSVTHDNAFEHELMPAGVAADPFGRLELASPAPTAPEFTDSGVAADPLG